MKKEVKNLCIDAFGTDAPEDTIHIIENYHERIVDLVDDYVNDCIENNIEYLSSLGFLLSRVQVAFVNAHNFVAKTKYNYKKEE